MDGYVIALKTWGLYVQIGRDMTREGSAAFFRDLEAGYRCLQREKGHWVSVYDLRELDLDTVRLQDFEALGHLARQLEGGRVSVIVGDLRAVAFIVESNRACGLADRCRVVLANAGNHGGVKAAYGWALGGVEPPPEAGVDPGPDRTASPAGIDKGRSVGFPVRHGLLQGASWA